MRDPTELERISEQGKRDFEAGRFETAADVFRHAARAYADLGDQLNAAEQRNNLSVTLLKLHRPEEALNEVAGSDEVFATADDKRRQGMAWNNQAAALQDLGREDEALAAYERAAQFLGEAGEDELRAVVLRAAAAIQLRRGKFAESGLKMLGAFGVGSKLAWLDRLLKRLLHLS